MDDKKYKMVEGMRETGNKAWWILGVIILLIILVGVGYLIMNTYFGEKDIGDNSGSQDSGVGTENLSSEGTAGVNESQEVLSLDELREKYGVKTTP